MNHPLLAILNTLWQSAAIAALVWLVLRLARGTNAATRHSLWWVVLAVAVLLPAVPARRSHDPAPSPARFVRTHDTDAFAIPVGPRQPVEPAPRPRSVQLPSGDWPSIVLSLWAFVCLFQFARIAWSYRRLRILKRDARPADAALLHNFDAWVLACGIRRPVRLLISSAIASPIAVGFRRPAILLPEPLLSEFQDDELDHVLLHELAHIARRDDWTNLAARLAGGLFAFHPVALWLVRQIDRERELACDDWVVSMTGAPRPYASCLTRLFELCHPRNRLVLASGMASRASHLGERVERLLRARQFFAKTSFVKLGFGCVALIAAGLAFSQTPRFLAIAQERHEAPLPPEAPEAPDAPAAPEAQEAPEAPGAPEAPQPPAAPPSPQGGFLSGLVAAGYGDLSVDEIIGLKSSGVDARYIAGMADAGWGRVGTRDLIELHNNGVSPAYARAVHAAGLRDASLKTVIQLRLSGVDPEAVARIHALGYGPFNAAEAIDLHNNGVRFELIQAFHDAGWKELSHRDLVEAQRSGIHAGSLREARQFGSSLTLKQIIRLKQAGVIG
jgi:beta-lactamase regulating signal transducer with metallopeptidase domain